MNDFDDYLDSLPRDQRDALQRIRDLVHGIVPGAEEIFSHGIPALRSQGLVICGLAADEHSCLYVPFSNAVLTALHAHLRAYRIDRGVIRFQPENPLGRVLVRSLVQTRMRQAESASRADPR
ncbi:MAG: iron chaperone [Actinomycetales bacterium]